jgi:hypothetical protein
MVLDVDPNRILSMKVSMELPVGQSTLAKPAD